jgi:restriction system protein
MAVGFVLLGIYFAVKRKINAVQLPNSGNAADPRIEPMLMPTAASTAVHTPATRWSADVFAAIEWRRFEAVCEALFAQAGFSTRAQSHGADGGVDIWLHSANAQGPVGVVQCKHWQGKPVGVKEMREFFGVMASHKLQRGTYATTSTYTADAKQFAKDNSINALDGPALLALIAKRTPEQQQALLAVAYEGDYWRPTCASCGTKMMERTPDKGGAAFWGCASYPKCRRTLQMAS